MPFLNLKSTFKNIKFNNGRSFVASTTDASISVLDLQTTLTSLEFGNDRPGYGSSGLPYIQTQIPSEPNSPGLYKPIFKPGTTGNLDYPIRGGSIEFQVGQETFTLSNNIDSTRIKKFFEDKPRGISFIQKQVGLQLSNPKIETGNVLFGLGQAAAIPSLLENTRVYNLGKNTLAQIKVSGTGGHALRQGLVPFAAYQRFYYETVNQQNVNNVKTSNRLVNLANLKMTNSTTPFVDSENVLDINLVNNLGISLNRNMLFQYLGGPGSTYGIGSTNIKRVVDTSQLGVTFKQYAGRNAMTYNKLRSQTINNYTDGRATTNIQDFRVWNQKGHIPWDNKEVDRFYVAVGNYQDRLNKLGVIYSSDSTKDPWDTSSPETDDLIRFVFEAVDNDNPDQALAIFFRAFLTSGITDNNSSKLTPVKYAGRGENFYTYEGFDRSISFSFRVAAGSQSELIPMYNRLNALVSQVYPDYSSKSSFMRAPLVKITIGDYMKRMPGFLESVNITVDNRYPWEINLYNLDNLAQLPQVVDVSISFKPILNELPSKTKYINQDIWKDTPQEELNPGAESGKTAFTKQGIYSPAIIATGLKHSTDEEKRNGQSIVIEEEPPLRQGTFVIEEIINEGFDPNEPNNILNTTDPSEFALRSAIKEKTAIIVTKESQGN